MGSISGVGYGLAEIDPATDTVVGSLGLGNISGTTVCQNVPNSLVLSSNGSIGYTTCGGSSNGWVVGMDLDTSPPTGSQAAAVIGWAPVGNNPVFPVLSGSTLYVANYNSGTVSAVATGTLANATPTVTTLADGLASQPDALAVVNGVLYVANYGYDNVTPYSTATGTALASGPIEVGGTVSGSAPVWMAADGSSLYVENYSSQSVSVIDTSSQVVTDTIALSGYPVDIVFG